MPGKSFVVSLDQVGQTLAAALRAWLPGRSWSEIRRLIEKRHVRIGGDLCLDPARRMKEGDRVELMEQPTPLPHQRQPINILYLDREVVVVAKPAGLNTVRHPAERKFSERRKELTPTLQDLLPQLIGEREGRYTKGPPPRLRIVHRLDKETSGLVVFARTVEAERALGRQFKQHSVQRRYLAVIPGYLPPQTIATRLVRDRGDGRRGSTAVPGVGKEAITHVEVVERLPGYTLVACRLETGRTHQIRIHLAELGHPICGEKVYNRKPGGEPEPDESGAPRLALHAAELGFIHPVSGASFHWSRPLPADLQGFLARLRQ